MIDIGLKFYSSGNILDPARRGWGSGVGNVGLGDNYGPVILFHTLTTI